MSGSGKRERSEYFKQRRQLKKQREKELQEELSDLKLKVKQQVNNIVFLKQVDVVPDGNCMFSSVGFFYSEDHRTVRRKIHQYLLNHQEQGLQQLLGSQRRSYLEKLKKSGTYGGENELIAAARTYKFAYRVFVQRESSYFLLGTFLHDAGYDDMINLLLIQGEEDDQNHYSPLVQIGAI